jgi:ribonucleotide monophosphatase NagD (HAD superfamily)
LRINGVEPTDAAVNDLAVALVEGYEDARAELASTGRVLPDANRALAGLADDPAVCQTVLIGDTSHDVTAGLRAGVRVIGVTTGTTTADELRQAGASWVVDTVEAAERVVTRAMRGRDEIPDS